MQAVEPQSQHAWLQQLVGEWTYEVDGEEKAGGREIIKPIGPLWIVGESEFTMPGGGTGTARITVGFDPQKGRFVGTWIGSMMTYLWVYDRRTGRQRPRADARRRRPQHDRRRQDRPL